MRRRHSTGHRVGEWRPNPSRTRRCHQDPDHEHFGGRRERHQCHPNEGGRRSHDYRQPRTPAGAQHAATEQRSQVNGVGAAANAANGLRVQSELPAESRNEEAEPVTGESESNRHRSATCDSERYGRATTKSYRHNTFDGNITEVDTVPVAGRARRQAGSRVSELAAYSVSVKPAPEPLAVIQRLVNTRNSLNGYDLLEDLPTARAWLAVVQPRVLSGQANSRRQLTESDLDRLRELREALRSLLLAHASGQTPGADIVARLRSLGANSHLRVDFDPLGTPVLTIRNDHDVVGSQVDAAFAALVAVQPDQLRRLKACVNPACGWVFYDTSRSRSGTWCVMEVCGARHKMAQYRHRAKRPSG
jgi:predicted RNA-binding Zn ribbon-like protein